MSIIETIILVLYSFCLFFIFCYSLTQLHLTFLYWFRKRKPEEDKALENWPAVTIQLPVYNERYVVERLLDAVLALDYPADKLQVQVLDDSTDETSALIQEKLKAYENSGVKLEHIRRSIRTGYKAGALQHGLQSANGEFIGIFDADFIPSKDFLKQTIPAFKEARTGVVQSRWGHLNQDYSLLTKLQAFGLNAHFTIEQQGRSLGKHFLNFNGTAGVWRKSCIVDAGGWQSDTLTEDLDLSYRAQLKGWRIAYLEHLVTPAELPASIGALRAQQYRWTKGAAETAKKHVSKVLTGNIPFSTKLHAVFHLLNSAVFICVLVSALLSVPLLYIKANTPEIQPLFMFGSLLLLSFVALAGFYWTSRYQVEKTGSKEAFKFIPEFLLFLSVSMGMSLYNSLAVLEGYAGKKTPFIRTPKYNIRHKGDNWRQRSYFMSGISFMTILEGLLSVYFIFAIGLAFMLKDYGLLPFHIMLALGFGIVFIYSLLHSRQT